MAVGLGFLGSHPVFTRGWKPRQLGEGGYTHPGKKAGALTPRGGFSRRKGLYRRRIGAPKTKGPFKGYLIPENSRVLTTETFKQGVRWHQPGGKTPGLKFNSGFKHLPKILGPLFERKVNGGLGILLKQRGCVG